MTRNSTIFASARRAAFGLLALLIVLPFAAAAQEAAPAETEANVTEADPLLSGLPQLEIGLSTDTIYISSDFDGANLTIFGAITDMAGSEDEYGISVVLEGPSETASLHRKQRVFGIWVNTANRDIANVPLSYSLATTQNVETTVSHELLAQLGIGIDAIGEAQVLSEPSVGPFAEALRRRRTLQGLYSENPAGVQFLSGPLFRATLSLPAEIPVGLHVVEASLFRSGALIDRATLPLIIAKSDIEQRISYSARNDAALYGIFAVFLAVVTGWLGRLLFKRD